MNSLRIVAAAIGTLASMIVCAPLAFEWLLYETTSGLNAGQIILGILFSSAVLAGPFGLGLAATLSEGQFTRGNSRLLLSTLGVGVVVTTLVLLAGFRSLGGVFLLTDGVALLCLLVVIRCLAAKLRAMASVE